MSENNEFYSGILILYKDGLYLVKEKRFKSLENAKTYIDTFLNLSDSPKISATLTINDVINSIELKNYFGNKAEKWIPELTKLVEKKKIGDLEVNDDNIKHIRSWETYKFSWLGLLFGNFWGIYHKSLWWWQILIGTVILDIIIAVILEIFELDFFIFPMGNALYCTSGKTLLLMGKASELKSKGKLMPASWKRLSILIIISIVMAILALYL
ncbi:hypothetical protein N8870_06805 [Alphaproteobacteria bacterium]|nr:hypothetical protein [Alphaproteobacteria bacterium]